MSKTISTFQRLKMVGNPSTPCDPAYSQAAGCSLDIETPFMDEVRRQERALERLMRSHFVRGWLLGAATLSAIWFVFRMGH
jgi:hypothetical protein